MPAIRPEVLKKLVNMLKTNPYPTVRFIPHPPIFSRTWYLRAPCPKPNEADIVASGDADWSWFVQVRVAVAECLHLVTRNEILKDVDWSKPARQNERVLQELQHDHVGS